MNYIKASIYQSEMDFIAKCVLDYPNLETGGDFFGFWTKEGYPVVQYVIGPGKKTTRTSTSFYQDIDYLKECGKFLNGKYSLEHIGGWHSHHRLSLAHPSGGDISTMRNLLQNTNIEKFLISIANINGKSSVSINGFLFAKNYPNDYTNCNWHVLEGISPIRAEINKIETNVFIPPDTKKVAEEIVTENKEVKIDKKDSVEKPTLPTDSFWKTDQGKKVIKEMYLSLKDRKDISDFEMIQKEDERLAFRFVFKKVLYEIILPQDYPNKHIEIHKKLPNNIFANIEFPSTKRRSISSDFDLTLRYMETKFNKMFNR